MILQIVKELEAKNHFFFFFFLPINNPKRDIVGTNAYAKFE